MDTERMGPATPPHEAAISLYREAMVAWRNGDLEGFANFLDLASKCSLVSLAHEGVHVL
jgi:hypothetical protein